tara:strand:+ start:600 stop:914 length:315 start_codon:yes stop_codon:yes gene_type:complete
VETPSSRYLKEFSNGNRNFEMKILNILLEELPKEYFTYEKAVMSKNFFWASEIVCRIKHKIVFFEMWKALSLIEKHEEALIIGDLKHHNEFQKIISSLLNFLPE